MKTIIGVILFPIILLSLSSCKEVNNFEGIMSPENNIDSDKALFIIDTSAIHFDYGDAVAYIEMEKGEYFYHLLRIVALPGDSISVKDDQYCIEGKQVYYRKIKENVSKNGEYSFDEYEEIMPNGKKNHIISSLSLSQKTYLGDTLTVPRNHYYLLGDLRSFSIDSRFMGAVPQKAIKGKAVKKIMYKNFFQARWAFYKYALWDYKKEKVEAL